MCWRVVDFNESFGGNHLDLDGGEESQSAIGPGDGVEQVRVLRAGALHHRAVRQNQLVGDTNVLELKGTKIKWRVEIHIGRHTFP